MNERRELAERWVDAIWGERQGYFLFAFGVGGRFGATGKYEFAHWHERSGRWPDDRERFLVEALEKAGECDVYVAPYLRSKPTRKKGAALPSDVLYGDLDHLEGDLRGFERLLIGPGGLLVASGGGLHPYLRLPVELEADELEHWNRRLARVLDADAGWAENKVLRLSGTFNHKARARGGESTPVVLLDFEPAPKDWTLQDLGELLPEIPAATANGSAAIAPAAIPEKLPARVRERLNEAPSGDRSKQAYAFVALCLKEGLSDGETLALGLRHLPTVDKFGERASEDIVRMIGKCRAAEQVPAEAKNSIPSTKTEHGKKRIWSALELASLAPICVPWVIPPWFAAGAVTEVEGKIKAAGKTTFMLAGCRAALDGAPFMGEPTERTPVVYLTEQPRTSFAVALRRAGLGEREDFRVVSLWDVDDLDWFEIVALAREECARTEARLLVVDTLSAFARLEGDAENQAGAAQAAVRPLQVLAHEDGLAIGFGRHSRKGGGAVGESGRGSSAFAGAVDLLVSIRRREGNYPASQRVLYTLGRFDEPPDDLVIDLTEAGYVVLGSEATVEREVVRQTILGAVTHGGLTADELLAAVKEEITDEVSRNMVLAARKSLLDEGALLRSGTGRKGSPYTYGPAPEFLSIQSPSIREETNSGEESEA